MHLGTDDDKPNIKATNTELHFILRAKLFVFVQVLLQGILLHLNSQKPSTTLNTTVYILLLIYHLLHLQKYRSKKNDTNSEDGS